MVRKSSTLTWIARALALATIAACSAPLPAGEKNVPAGLDLRSAAGTQPGPADLILVNGKVVTVDHAFSIRRAVAIKDGRFLAVGGEDEIRALAGPETRVVELRGRTVLPGLIEGHSHTLRGGLTYARELRWRRARSIPEALAMVREKAAALPPGTWIFSLGEWHEDQFVERRLPTRAELDLAAPDHPVFARRVDDRALINSAALRAAGITAKTPDPPGGRIERDPATGEATGVLWGTAAWLARSKIPASTFQEQLAGTRELFRDLNQLGLTAISDAFGLDMSPPAFQPVLSLHRSGELTMRVRYHLGPMGQAGRELDEYRAWAEHAALGFPVSAFFGDDLLRLIGAGEIITWRARDNELPWLGRPLPPPRLEEFREVASYLASRGWPLHMHTVNDVTASRLLDVLEEIHGKTPLVRPIFAHLEDASPETLRRIKALGGGVVIRDRMAFREELIGTWGAKNIRRAPPLRTMLEIGVPVAWGPDGARGTAANPFFALWWMVSGRSMGGTPMRAPEQLLTREEALRVLTRGGAWVNFDEDRLGAIEPGRLADLIVLSSDVLSIPEDDLPGVRSLLTVVGGRIVYAEGEFARHGLVREERRTR